MESVRNVSASCRLHRTLPADREPHGSDRRGLGKSYFVQNTTTQARMISIMIAVPWVTAACSATLIAPSSELAPWI
jgi:hypothetical protein